MSQPTATALDAARERLRAVVLDNLLNVADQTTDPYTAGEAIMDAAQQWVTDTATRAEPCPGSGTTVERWHEMPSPLDRPGAYADAPDPGPYTEGERVTCRHCSASVPVTPIANTRRSAGRQYVARLAQH